jgi:hypothetical protein
MTETRPVVLRWLSPRRAAYLVAAIVSVSFGYDLMRIPIQVSDSLSELLAAQRSSSAWASFAATVGTGAYLRPLRSSEIKVLFDLAQDRHYWLVYRGCHALLLATALLLFVRALDVRTWRDSAAATFALTVFTGLNTFRGIVREAFPINHFLIIVVLSLLALNLARSKGGWWVDVAAVVTFIVASLTLESGLLVWVVVVAAWACGMRGISRRGVMATTACLAAYFCARFVYFSTGMPGLDERSSGFLLSVLEPQELVERFGANPTWFYVYNVATSVLSVPFSDPDGGVFEILRARLRGDVPPRLYLAVVSSAATTALIGWAVVGRLRRRAPVLHEADGQLVAIAGIVLVANAAISYAYTKHEILSVAGAFYAFAAFVAARHAIGAWPASTRRVADVAVVLLLAVVATMWTARTLGVHHMLRVQAFKVRVDWARVSPDPMRDDGSPDDRVAAALVRYLRRDALEAPGVNPYLLPRWVDRWWGE